MNPLQKNALLIAIAALVFFFVLSVITSNWLFFIWSIVPVFLALMTTFFRKARTGK